MDFSPAIGWAIFLPASTPGLCVASSLVAFTAGRLAGRIPALRQQVLGFAVWCAALVVGYLQILSLAGQLHWPGALALAAAGALVARLCLPADPGRPLLSTRFANAGAAIPRGDAAWLLAFVLPALAFAGWSAWLICVSTEPGGDNLTYHLPRLAYWMQHQTLAPFVSNDPRMSTFPVNGNLLALWPALFIKHEQLCALVQLASHLGAALAVYSVGRAWGAPRPACAAAASCWLAVPVALSQSTVSNVDLVAAFFAVTTCSLAAACVRRPDDWTAWTCLACAALALGTKPQTLSLVLLALPAALHLFWRAGRARSLRRIPVGLGIGALLGGTHYLQNTLAFGSPAGFAALQWTVVNPGLPTLAKNLQLMLLPLTGGPGSRWSSWAPRTALFEQGVGLLWLLLVPCGLVRSAVGWARDPGRRGLPVVHAFVALVSALTVLGVMRHQPSIDRFLLPAVAVLTPFAASLFVGRLRTVGLAVVWLLGSGAMAHWAERDLANRRAPGAHLRFLDYVEMARPGGASLARASERLASERAGQRIGVVTSQSSLQRLLLGRRFENALIPLSYHPPLDLAALDRLGLDAFLLEMGGREFELQIFRHPWSPPARRPEPDGWRLTTPDAFDADFIRSYVLCVEGPRYEQTAVMLGRAGSGWKLDPSVRSNGMFFVRRRSERAALGIVHVENPSGVEEVNGRPLYWLGPRPSVLKVFAGAAGEAVLTGRFRRGASLRGDRAQVAVQWEGSPPVHALVVPGEYAAIPVSVRAGLNYLRLRVEDAPAPPDPYGRINQLGAVNLQIVWAGAP